MDKPVDQLFFDLKHQEIFIKKWILENNETDKQRFLEDLCLESCLPTGKESNFQILVEWMYKQRQTILTNYEKIKKDYPLFENKTVNEIFDKFVMDFINYYLKIYNIHNCEFAINELKENLNEFNETIKKMHQQNRVELVYLNLKIHELNNKIKLLKKKKRGCFNCLFSYQAQV